MRCSREKCCGQMSPPGWYWAKYRNGDIELVSSAVRQCEIGAIRGSRCYEDLADDADDADRV